MAKAVADRTIKAKSAKAKSAKGEIARAKLKAAALVVMEEVGYHKIRTTDVTQQAGVAAGLFYHYFNDLPSLTREVLEDYIGRALHLDDIEKDVGKGDWYGRMLAHNLLVVRSYHERPGIMRCLLQLADEDAEFAKLLRENWRQQLSWLITLMPKLFPDVVFAKHQAKMLVYTLAGTGERVLRDYYINREASLLQADLTVEEFAELLTVMFYRGLFLENPPEEKLSYTHNLRFMHKTDQ